jgi:hypothetical protein
MDEQSGRSVPSQKSRYLTRAIPMNAQTDTPDYEVKARRISSRTNETKKSKAER